MKARMEELEREKAEIMTRLHEASHEVATLARETMSVRAKIAEARADIIVDLRRPPARGWMMPARFRERSIGRSLAS